MTSRIPDPIGFGRREMRLTPLEVRDLVLYQVGALTGFLAAECATLNHIKPHGALFGMASRERELMKAICEVAAQYAVPVHGLPGTEHERIAEQCGVVFISEYYVDLDYDDDGTLMIARSASMREPADAEERIRRLVERGVMLAQSGIEMPVRAESVCASTRMPTTLPRWPLACEALSERSRARRPLELRGR